MRPVHQPATFASKGYANPPGVRHARSRPHPPRPGPHPPRRPPGSRADGIHREPPAQPRVPRGRHQPLRPGAHDQDQHVVRLLPAPPRPGAGQPRHRRRRGRPTSTSRSATPARWPGTPPQRPWPRCSAGWASRRGDDDAAQRGRPVGGRGADQAVRYAVVELHALGDRREPVGDPSGPGSSRVVRRSSCSLSARWWARSAPGPPGEAGGVARPLGAVAGSAR